MSVRRDLINISTSSLVIDDWEVLAAAGVVAAASTKPGDALLVLEALDIHTRASSLSRGKRRRRGWLARLVMQYRPVGRMVVHGDTRGAG